MGKKWLAVFGRGRPDTETVLLPVASPRHDYIAESETLAHFFNFTRADVAASIADCQLAAGKKVEQPKPNRPSLPFGDRQGLPAAGITFPEQMFCTRCATRHA